MVTGDCRVFSNLLSGVKITLSFILKQGPKPTTLAGSISHESELTPSFSDPYQDTISYSRAYLGEYISRSASKNINTIVQDIASCLS